MLLRVAAFVAVLAVIAVAELALRRGRATKWREYGFLFVGGFLGAAFGLLHDLVVSFPLSPEYFVIGKELSGGEGLAWRVAEMGLAAGFGPGALVAGTYLLANSGESRPQLPYSRLARQFWRPPAGAAMAAAFFAFTVSSWDPLGFRPLLELEIGGAAARRFVLVWWIHLGLYTGCVAGILSGIVTLRRARRRL